VESEGNKVKGTGTKLQGESFTRAGHSCFKKCETALTMNSGFPVTEGSRKPLWREILIGFPGTARLPVVLSWPAWNPTTPAKYREISELRKI
jgi:hypothetical protein